MNANSADAVRLAVQKCTLINRRKEMADCVCTRDCVELLSLEEILIPGLALAQQMFEESPWLVSTDMTEATDLMHELIVRYGEGKRLYKWPHWEADESHTEWTKFVFYRMIGRTRQGVMASIAGIRNDADRRPPPTISIGGPGDVSEGPGDYLDLEEIDLTNSDDLVDASAIEALAISPQLMHGAIQECAASGGFNPYDDKALDVYRDAYQRACGHSNQTIANRWNVLIEFVEMLRDADVLITRLRNHCRKETLDRICDAVSNVKAARALGFTKSADSEI